MAHKSFLSFCHRLMSFFTALLLLTLYIVSKTYAFTLHFVLSHFSVLCKEGGGKLHNKPFHNSSALEGGICVCEWDLCLGIGSVLVGGISVLVLYHF